MSIPLAKSDVDWMQVSASLDNDGFAVIPRWLPIDDCNYVRGLYDDENVRFRSTVDMARYNFGRGQYRYFEYPLPAAVQSIREYFYSHLAPIANLWECRLGREPGWPDTLAGLRDRCRENGQCRPTPLLLRYAEGDYNCLHQDLYGSIHFPLQVVVLLSAPQSEFDGGELVLVEQRPRMQSRPIVVHLEQGSAAVIPVRERPRKGKRGYHRAPMRHGVGEVLSGKRVTLGVIFHDAA